MRFNLSILIVLLLCACENGTKLGRHVYIDGMNILHVDEDCPKLKDGRYESGHAIYAMHPCDTADLAHCSVVCSKCVNAETYELLNRIAERNWFDKCENNRRWLYQILEKDYITEMPAYEDFEKELAAPMSRRNIYDMIEGRKSYYYHILKYRDYDDFSRLMGFDE